MTTPVSTAERLSRQLAATFGSNLRSVVLFGSVARGEAIPGMSDVNVLVLLDQVDNSDLLLAAPLTQDWVRAGNTPPYMFSSAEWSGMRDTFAIEISDMQDARQVLHGPDPIPAASIQLSDLRLHAEHEIRETARHLRLRMLLAANAKGELGRLLVAGVPSFGAYMRAVLRLSGQEAPLKTLRTIEAAAALIGVDPASMIHCLKARQACAPPKVAITHPLVEGYTEFVGRLIEFIDQSSH